MEIVDKLDVEKILKKLWKKDDGQPSENRVAFNEALQKVQVELDTLEKKEITEMNKYKAKPNREGIKLLFLAWFIGIIIMLIIKCCYRL
jgi:hypothetical protein